MRHILIALTLIGLITTLTADRSTATSLLFKEFDPETQDYTKVLDTIYYNYNDVITFRLYADIDVDDAILGFDFDLNIEREDLQNGVFPNFSSFTPNDALFENGPAFWDDDDGISGEVPFGDPDLYGLDLYLGDFAFLVGSETPFISSLENLTLTLYPETGEFDEFSTDGLIRGSGSAFMPNNPTISFVPVPEPSTLFLLVSGFIVLATQRKRMGRKCS